MYFIVRAPVVWVVRAKRIFLEKERLLNLCVLLRILEKNHAGDAKLDLEMEG
jgi:hypothetical protein